MNRIIIALAIILAYFSCDAQQYGYIEQPICWTIGGVDSSLTRIVYSNVQGGGPISTHVINSSGNIVSIIGGTVTMGYCGCCSGGGGTDTIPTLYNASDTINEDRVVTIGDTSVLDIVTTATLARMKSIINIRHNTLFGAVPFMDFYHNSGGDPSNRLHTRFTTVGGGRVFDVQTRHASTGNGGIRFIVGQDDFTVDGDAGVRAIFDTPIQVQLGGIGVFTELPTSRPIGENSLWMHKTDGTGQYLDCPSLVDSLILCDSTEQVQFFSGTTSASGELTITPPYAMPSGNYHIDVSILSGIFPWFSTVVSSTNTSFTIKVWNATTGASVNSTSVALTYHILTYR